MNRRQLLKSASLFSFLGLENLSSQKNNKLVPPMLTPGEFVIHKKIHMPKESYNDFKNWSAYQLDEFTRKQIYQVSVGDGETHKVLNKGDLF